MLTNPGLLLFATEGLVAETGIAASREDLLLTWANKSIPTQKSCHCRQS